MSDVSKTNELIAEARRLEGDYSDNHEVVTHMSVLADALEAATRVPVQGEPNDDRTPEFEAIEQELFKHQPLLSMQDGSIRGCKCMDRVFVTKTEDWGTHLAEVFTRLSRATVPDAATEEPSREWLEDVAETHAFCAERLTIEVKKVERALAERDAALAAVEPEAGTKVVIGKQNRGDDDESWTFTEWEPLELEKAREEFPNSVYEVVTVFGLPVEGESE